MRFYYKCLTVVILLAFTFFVLRETKLPISRLGLSKRSNSSLETINDSSANIDIPIAENLIHETMNELGKFLQTLKSKIEKAEDESQSDANILTERRLALLEEIDAKRAEIDRAEATIRDRLRSGMLSNEDRTDLELHLYNCATFRDLTDASANRIKSLLQQQQA